MTYHQSMRWGTLCLLAILAGKASSAETWIRVSSPPIEIFTDNGEKSARAVLHRFETLHRVFGESHIALSPAPLRVFIFSSRSDFLAYEIDNHAAAFYLPGDDLDFIVLFWGSALTGNASHEFLHRVVEHASTPLPRWLNEGIAEFYSTVSTNSTTVRIGGLIESRLSVLASQRWLSAEDLALGSSSDGPIFYAESWALVHMLSLSPQWRDGMPEFVKLLNDGREQSEAFRAAFGKPMEEALAALHSYLRSPKTVTVPLPPMDETEPYQVTRLAPVDARLALADLALSTSHPALARSLFLNAARKNPESPAAAAGLGWLALAENRNDDAQHEMERAIAMGYRDARIYFELAVLKNDSSLLEQALTIDSKLAVAHFLLGTRATDSGNFVAAIEHLRQAVAIQPRRFTYWHALAFAEAKSGDRQNAAESARRAVILASTSQEEEMAAALALLASEAPPIHVKKPAVVTPPSWQNRKGDARVEGTLTRVDCGSVPVRLIVSTGTPAQSIELNVQNPNEVELLNAEGASTTLVCGEQSRPVAVEYVAQTREITRIEFRHDIIKR
jgi:tetratricopeptide (TPR) repeat protein